MWWRRPRVPFWVMILALLGVKSILRRGRMRNSPDFESRRRRFKGKMDEAFRVWQEPEDEATDSPSEAE